MAIAQVYTFHPHPGRTADFMAIAKKADRIFRALGATTQTINSVSGGVAGTILYVVETADWKAFGDVAAKLQTDKAWQALAAEMNSTDKPLRICFPRRCIRKFRSADPASSLDDFGRGDDHGLSPLP